jgi:chromosome partitioning protein
MRTMKIIVVANQKGGVGKSTIVHHLAHYFAEIGKRVAVIDLDKSSNVTSSLEASSVIAGPASALFSEAFQVPKSISGAGTVVFRGDDRIADLDSMPVESAMAAFQAAVDAIGQTGIDLCLVDTAPTLNIALVSALTAADFVLSPMELEAYSIQGIAHILRIIQNCRKANPRLRFLGMLPSMVDTRHQRHQRHREELAEAYPNMVMPVYVPQRASIADAVGLGVPVWKIKTTAARKAAREVKEVAAYVAGKLETAQ